MPAQILNFDSGLRNSNRVVNRFLSAMPVQQAWINVVFSEPLRGESMFSPKNFIMYDHAFYKLNLQAGDKVSFIRTGQVLDISLFRFMQSEQYEVITGVLKVDATPVTHLRP